MQSAADATPFRLLLNVHDQSTLAALRHAQKRGKRIIFLELDHHNAQGAVIVENNRKAFSVSPRRRVTPEAIAGATVPVPMPSAPGVGGGAGGAAAKSLAGRTLSSAGLLHRSNTESVATDVKRVIDAAGAGQQGLRRVAEEAHEEENEDAISSGTLSPVIPATGVDQKPKLQLNLGPVDGGAGAGSAGGAWSTGSSTGRGRGTTASSFDDPSLISELLLGPAGVAGSLSARSKAGGSVMTGRAGRAISGGSGQSLGLSDAGAGGGAGTSAGAGPPTNGSWRTPGRTAEPSAVKPAGVVSPLAGWPEGVQGAGPVAPAAAASFAFAGPGQGHGRSMTAATATTTGPVRRAPGSALASTSNSIAAANAAAASAALGLALEANALAASRGHHQQSISLDASGGAGISPTKRKLPLSASTAAQGGGGVSGGKLSGALKGIGAGFANSQQLSSKPAPISASAKAATATSTAAASPPSSPAPAASSSSSRSFYQNWASTLLNTGPLRSLKAALGGGSSAPSPPRK